jgi:uncharacterized protein (TIGR00255 family)
VQKVNESEESSFKLISMTGFGQAHASNKTLSVMAKVRSLNHRGLDIRQKLSEEISFLEPSITALITQLFDRGRIEIEVNTEGLGHAGKLSFNELFFEDFLSQINDIKKRFPSLAVNLTLADLLAVPGLIEVKANSYEDLQPFILKVIEDALAELKQARVREGAMLSTTIAAVLVQCSHLINDIEERANSSLKERLARLKQRLDELFSPMKFNEERVYQEFALLLERSDFAEEIDRLKAHIKHFDAIGCENTKKGRRLDFLCQEMLRETNTLMSKTFDHTVSIKAIDLKAYIERLREQVQNIE